MRFVDQSRDPDDVFLQEFRLTEQHLKLLQRMYVGWFQQVEYGAPQIDPKRPYGHSNVEVGICEILGMPMIPHPDDVACWTFSDESRRAAAQLHTETMYALQIVLWTQSFRPGLYRRTEKYDRRAWEFVRE